MNTEALDALWRLVQGVKATAQSEQEFARDAETIRRALSAPAAPKEEAK